MKHRLSDFGLAKLPQHGGYVVVRDFRFDRNPPTILYEDFGEAQADAMRLAQENPMSFFVVLETSRIVRSQRIVVEALEPCPF